MINPRQKVLAAVLGILAALPAGAGAVQGSRSKIVLANGEKYTTIQAAINALPSSGGTVTIPPGTYTGPSSIPNSNTSLMCETWMGCTFTYSSNVSFGSSSQGANGFFQHIAIWGVIFDFGNTSAGLTFADMQQSEFSIIVQNTTGDALTLLGQGGANNPWPSSSNAFNTFDYLGLRNVGEGLVLNGDANIPNCGGGQATGGAVFLNHFVFVDIQQVTGANAIKFTSGADSLVFDRVYMNLASGNTTANGILLGSRCSTSYGNIDLEHFNYVSMDVVSGWTGYGVVANSSRGIIENLQTTGTGTRGFINNGYGAWTVGYVGIDPLGLTTPSMEVPAFTAHNSSYLSALSAATSGNNYYAPTLNWRSNVWSGSRSGSATWSLSPAGDSRGTPTFDNLMLTHSASSTSNTFLVASGIKLGLGHSDNTAVSLSAADSPGKNYSVTFPDYSGTAALTIAHGSATLASSSIAAGACTTTVTAVATGVATTDEVSWSYASFPAPSTDGRLILNAWPAANGVNLALCNPGAGSITSSGLTVNWRVVR